MLRKVNLKKEAQGIENFFEYVRVGSLNNHMLTLLKASNRKIDFHVHENSDELFFCVEGNFCVELTDGMVYLSDGDMLIVPRGTKHRPVCETPSICLLIELDGTLNQENTGGAYRD